MRAGAAPAAIMASMLTADLSALGEQCRALERAGIDGIHWDVMDGTAVASLSFGPTVIAACRPHVHMPFEAHVMTRTPETLLDELARSGCGLITVHPDWIQNPRRTLQRIKDLGLCAGVALSPGSPVGLARWHLDIVDLVLVMSVEPGFGGQEHIPLMTEKIREVTALVRDFDRPVAIEVDGGIGFETIAGAYAAGARKFVVGSALWRSEAFPLAVRRLRESMAAAPREPDHADRSPEVE